MTGSFCRLPYILPDSVSYGVYHMSAEKKHKSAHKAKVLLPTSLYLMLHMISAQASNTNQVINGFTKKTVVSYRLV